MDPARYGRLAVVRHVGERGDQRHAAPVVVGATLVNSAQLMSPLLVDADELGAVRLGAEHRRPCS